MKMYLQNGIRYSSYNSLVEENKYSISFEDNKQKNLVTTNAKIEFYNTIFSLLKWPNKYITETTISVKDKKLHKLIWEW